MTDPKKQEIPVVFLCFFLTMFRYNIPIVSVADPHHFNADPANLDTNPACHFDEDPDADPYLSFQ